MHLGIYAVDGMGGMSDFLTFVGGFVRSYADAPYTLSNEERRLVKAYREIKDESGRNGLLAIAELAARK